MKNYFVDDKNLYPSEAELLRIKTAKVNRDNLDEFMNSFKDYWSKYGSWRKQGNYYRLATGGWSGNEEIISALMGNLQFWYFYWTLSMKGGLFIFGHTDHWEDCEKDDAMIREWI